MANGYSQSPKLLKGALIQFSAPMLVPIPNLIVFQYNPETMSRTLTPWAPPDATDKPEDPKKNERSQPYDPSETFSLALELDAADALEDPDNHPIAVVSGVADRIAALEMLLYPPGTSALGSLNVSVDVSVGSSGFSASASVKADALPQKNVPVVLFFWGPGRIVPVRITSFSVDEQAYSPTLYPLRAKVTVGMKVLTDQAFANEKQTAEVKIAIACYKFTRVQKELLAAANVANSVESIVGMLPSL